MTLWGTATRWSWPLHVNLSNQQTKTPQALAQMAYDKCRCASEKNPLLLKHLQEFQNNWQAYSHSPDPESRVVNKKCLECTVVPSHLEERWGADEKQVQC